MTEIVQQAVTERGAIIQHTDDEVTLAFKLLTLSGGNLKETSRQLAAEGFKIHRNTLRSWRDRSFPRRYAEVRRELGKEVSEEIAGRALERALEYDEAEKLYVQEAIKKLPFVDPNHLAKNALSLASAKSHSIQNAQLLRDKPTAIVETKGVDELVAVLERTGVAKKVDVEVIDGDAEEVEEPNLP